MRSNRNFRMITKMFGTEHVRQKQAFQKQLNKQKIQPHKLNQIYKRYNIDYYDIEEEILNVDHYSIICIEE